MRRLLILLFFISAVYTGPLVASAQFNELAGSQVLSLVLSPEYPRPHDVLVITPKSDIVNLANGRLVFKVNGVVVGETTGRTPLTIQTGPAGQRLEINVTAVVDGTTYEEEIVMYPQDVVVAMEPQSTTHAFYKGAALLPTLAQTRLVAIAEFRTPAGTLIPPSALSYVWYVGDRVLADQSGIGRQVLRIEGPRRYRPTEVSVIVTSREYPYVGEARLTLDPIDPVVRMYKNNPLVGPWTYQAIRDQYVMQSEEEVFVAIPYFFDTAPQLSWKVQGTEQGNSDIITVRSAGAGSGSARLSVSATGKNVFSFGEASTQVTFGSVSSPFRFGL